MPRLAVLVSGAGTNLQSILSAGLPVQLVIADRHCQALQIAADRKVPATLINRLRYGYRPRAGWDRGGFTQAIVAELQANQIDLVAMAGFMTILGPGIFDGFTERILNTHPSLLPAFKGAHAVPLALAAGVPETGVTVHIATPALDSGRILAQATVPVLPGDTESTLHARIKAAEHQLYPATIRDYLATIKAY